MDWMKARELLRRRYILTVQIKSRPLPCIWARLMMQGKTDMSWWKALIWYIASVKLWHRI